MKAIIIPQDKKDYYQRQLSGFEAIEPAQLPSGEWFFSLSIIDYLTYLKKDSQMESVRKLCEGLINELWGYEIREIDPGIQTTEPELFPYPDLNIRVFIEHKNITRMTESPYSQLIQYALLCTKQYSDEGYTIWLSFLENPQMTAEEVKQVLESFGAQIMTK